MILSATPAGPEAAARRVLREIRTYRHCARSSAGNLTAMIRIALLAQIDVFWWGHLPAYQSDADVHDAADLLDLDGLRRDGMLLFRYRRQATTLLGRAARSAERRAAPDRAPQHCGPAVRLRPGGADRAAQPDRRRLRRARAARHAAAVGHQPRPQRRRISSICANSATRPCCRAAHCVGYAADVEMTWFRQFEADRTAAGACCLSGSEPARSTSSTRARPGTCACALAPAARCGWSPTSSGG